MLVSSRIYKEAVGIFTDALSLGQNQHEICSSLFQPDGLRVDYPDFFKVCGHLSWSAWGLDDICLPRSCR
jgi:hypothetical protein